MQHGPNGTALFAEISSHVQDPKKLIALINILTTDVLPSWLSTQMVQGNLCFH